MLEEQFCRRERRNVPGSELATFQRVIYHVEPSDYDPDVADSGHLLRGYNATIRARRVRGVWQIEHTGQGLINLPNIRSIQIITARLDNPAGTGITFQGPIIRIPTAFHEEPQDGEEAHKGPLMEGDPHEKGYGELFHTLFGDDEEWLQGMLSQDEGERDEKADLIASLVNGSDYSIERIMSQRDLQDPEELSGLVVGQTAVLFSADEDARVVSPAPHDPPPAGASPARPGMSITSLKTLR